MRPHLNLDLKTWYSPIQNCVSIQKDALWESGALDQVVNFQFCEYISPYTHYTLTLNPQPSALTPGHSTAGLEVDLTRWWTRSPEAAGLPAPGPAARHLPHPACIPGTLTPGPSSGPRPPAPRATPPVLRQCSREISAPRGVGSPRASCSCVKAHGETTGLFRGIARVLTSSGPRSKFSERPVKHGVRDLRRGGAQIHSAGFGAIRGWEGRQQTPVSTCCSAGVLTHTWEHTPPLLY